MTEDNPFDVVIIGSGLSGLTTAVRCQQAGLRVKVLEAAARMGGRVHSVYSESISSSSKPAYLADLGPTWVWPPYQATVESVVKSYKLKLIEQYNTGPAIVEQPGSPPQQHQLPGQHGMSRLLGGPQSIVEALASNLNKNTVTLNHRVTSLTNRTEHIEIGIADKPQTMNARSVVVAAPLRVTSQGISFTPRLSDKHQNLMESAATWMATQAKAVLFYQQAFWRHSNLSGRIASQIGPLTEVHDHSGDNGEPAALFGFIGVPAKARAEHRKQLREAIVTQMVRCFGPPAAQPVQVIIEDWATNPFICAQRDLAETPQHPGVLPELIRQSSWDGRLLFATAETSSTSPGLIDGALEAGARTADVLVNNQQC